MPVVEPLVCYRRPGLAPNTYLVRDARGAEYSYDAAHGTATLEVAGGSQYYNRIDWRAAARYRDTSQKRLQFRFGAQPARKQAQGVVAHGAKRKRTTTKQMNLAMLNLVGKKATATEYAEGTGAASGMRFEWSHLKAHGLGGGDGDPNIVAATRHCNSEQLIIESALHPYRNEPLFQVDIRASLLDGGASRHLGDVVHYRILGLHGVQVYEHYLDCFTHSRPTAELEGRIRMAVCHSLNTHLETVYPHGNPVTANDAMNAVRALP